MRTFQTVARLIRPWIGLSVLAGLALAGLLVLSLGCNGRPDQPLPPKFADIPVPMGFKLIPDKSSDRVVGGYRRISHMYKGEGEVRAVAEYYRRHMPELGWTLAQENLVASRQRFMFNKANESCHIIIYDDWGTKVQIELWPTGARTAETHPAATPAAVPGR